MLAIVEGAKQSGPVQIAAELARGWRIAPAAPGGPGSRVRGRYEVLSVRRGLLRLGLGIETGAGTLVLTGESRLVIR